MAYNSETNFQRRRRRNRAKLARINRADLPRLSVHRTNKQIYAQLICDVQGVTLAAASSLEPELREKLKNGSNAEAAAQVGKLLGERAVKAGHKKAMFDRGGFVFHGRVKALADAARESGMEL